MDINSLLEKERQVQTEEQKQESIESLKQQETLEVTQEIRSAMVGIHGEAKLQEDPILKPMSAHKQLSLKGRGIILDDEKLKKFRMRPSDAGSSSDRKRRSEKKRISDMIEEDMKIANLPKELEAFLVELRSYAQVDFAAADLMTTSKQKVPKKLVKGFFASIFAKIKSLFYRGPDVAHINQTAEKEHFRNAGKLFEKIAAAKETYADRPQLLALIEKYSVEFTHMNGGLPGETSETDLKERYRKKGWTEPEEGVNYFDYTGKEMVHSVMEHADNANGYAVVTQGSVTVSDQTTEPLFIHEPCTADVVQKEMGDCAFMAAIAAYVSKQPEMIRDMMIDNGKTVDVRFYTNMNKEHVPEPVYIRVDKKVNAHGAVGCLWVSILEKAYSAFLAVEQERSDNKSWGNDKWAPDYFRARALRKGNAVRSKNRGKKDRIDYGYLGNGGEGNVVMEHLSGKSVTMLDVGNNMTLHTPRQVFMNAIGVSSLVRKLEMQKDFYEAHITDLEDNLIDAHKEAKSKIIDNRERCAVLRNYVKDVPKGDRLRLPLIYKNLSDEEVLKDLKNELDQAYKERKEYLDHLSGNTILSDLIDKDRKTKDKLDELESNVDQIGIAATIQSDFVSNPKIRQKMYDNAFKKIQDEKRRMLATNRGAMMLEKALQEALYNELIKPVFEKMYGDQYDDYLGQLPAEGFLKVVRTVKDQVKNQGLAGMKYADVFKTLQMEEADYAKECKEHVLLLLELMERGIPKVPGVMQEHLEGSYQETAINWYDLIKKEIDKGTTIILGTTSFVGGDQYEMRGPNGEVLSGGIYGTHGYSVLNVETEPDTGLRFVTVRNPWASGGLHYEKDERGTIRSVKDKESETGGIFRVELNHLLTVTESMIFQ